MRNNPVEIQKTKVKELQLELPKTHIKITCPSCNTEAAAEHINIQDKIAKCGGCNAVFPFQEEVNQLLEQTTPTPPKQTILRPEGIEVFQFNRELELTFKKPFSGWLIPALMFFPFCAIMLTISYITIGTIPILLPIAFWMPALLFIYRAIVRATARITIDKQFLNISQRNRINTQEKSYPLLEVDQLYIKKLPNQPGYSLNAIINSKSGSKHVTLVPYLKSHSKVMYLEQVIEKHLGIIDREITATT